MPTKKLSIKKKFKDCLLPLTKAEYAGLEKQIVDAGRVIDPILTWKGDIVDGHHCYKIATKHGLPFKTEEMDFESDNHVLIWQMEHQVGQRNLETTQKENIAAALEETYTASGTYGANALERVAEVFGITRSTAYNWISNAKVRRDINPKVAEDLEAHKIKPIAAKDLKKLSKLPLEKQKKLVDKAEKNNVKVREYLPADPPKPKKEKKPGATSTSPGPEEPPKNDLRGKPIAKAFEEDFAETGYDEILQSIIEMREISKRLKKGNRGKWFMHASFLEALDAAEHEISRAVPYATCPKCDGKKCGLCRNAGIVPQHIIVDFESRNK